MTHSPKKSSVKLKSYDHFREVILTNFPDLQHKVFKLHHVGGDDVDYLRNLCGFSGKDRVSGNVSTLEPLLNYMLDNKHLYEWWHL